MSFPPATDSAETPAARPTPSGAWRAARTAPSLAEVYRSIPVSGRTWWRKLLAFSGPGYLVAVGYIDRKSVV